MHNYFLGLPWWLSGKESANVGDVSLTPGSGRSPGEGKSNPIQYFCLGNPKDRGAWWTTVHGVAESDTTERLSAQIVCGIVLLSQQGKLAFHVLLISTSYHISDR